jgi:SAM-dependent methyltransferase
MKMDLVCTGREEDCVRADRLRWDRRYAEGVSELDGPAVRYLVLWLPFLPRGRALDLAAGCGRNALFLAQHGYRVDALDISVVGVARLAARARAQSLRVRAAVIDLDDVVLPAAAYDLIVNTYYLNRTLLTRLPRALTPGGALIVETLLYDPAVDLPDKIARRVRPGELAKTFSCLDIAHYVELPADPPRRKHALCRMVAFRGSLERSLSPA